MDRSHSYSVSRREEPANGEADPPGSGRCVGQTTKKSRKNLPPFNRARRPTDRRRGNGTSQKKMGKLTPLVMFRAWVRFKKKFWCSLPPFNRTGQTETGAGRLIDEEAEKISNQEYKENELGIVHCNRFLMVYKNHRKNSFTYVNKTFNFRVKFITDYLSENELFIFFIVHNRSFF